MKWVYRSGDRVSMAVVSFVSEVENCETWILGALGDVTDPKSLADLFASDRS